MQGFQCLQFLLELLSQISFPLVKVCSGHSCRHTHTGLPPWQSSFLFGRRCRAWGLRGYNLHAWLLISMWLQHFSVQISLQFCKSLTNATSCNSNTHFLVPGWPNIHLSVVCYLVFNLGLIAHSDHAHRLDSILADSSCMLHACMLPCDLTIVFIALAPTHSTNYLPLNHHF